MATVRQDRRPTILLVEDSPDEEALVMRALQRSAFPCEILVTHTTEEALDYLLARGDFQDREPGNPDVIITDLRIAPMGGAELVTAIRNNSTTRAVPIVVLTGSASTDQIDDLYRRGANSFLEKPMDLDEYSDLVLGLAKYWGTLNISAISQQKPASFPYPL